MERLQSNYCNYTKDDIDKLLEQFTLDDLFIESIKCNPNAQKAYLVKIELGLHEAKEWSIKKRIDEILKFWKNMKEVNKNNNKFGLIWEFSIVGALKETVFHDNILYNTTSLLPNYSDYYYSICMMKEYDFSHEHISSFKEPYNLYIKSVKRTVRNQIATNKNKNDVRLGYTAPRMMFMPNFDSRYGVIDLYHQELLDKIKIKSDSEDDVV